MTKKMKHLLRKLHIGGGGSSSGGSASTTATSTSTSTSGSSTEALNEQQLVRPPAPNPNSLPSSSSSVNRGFDQAGNDYNFLEEQFQVQMALAISASADQNNLPPAVTDSETAQINTAKRISLNQNPTVDSLSLRYWSYNVVDYTDKITDGFYDVYGITSSSVMQGKMPTLVDLQAIPVSDNVDYEVILVNRLLDSELQLLEKRAHDVAVECQAYDCGSAPRCLIQKIADIVVERMGGPVGDAYETLGMWKSRSFELQKSLKNIILPLGCLNVGLSRHRALLFKVLADRINLPCMMVKGSCYTGTDDGAVNFIKIDNGSEFIIDLMGAPGTLIPAEVPTSHLSNWGLGLLGMADFSEVSKNGAVRASDMDDTSKVSNSRPEAANIDGETKKDVRNLCVNKTHTVEKDFESLLAPENKRAESSLSAKLSAQTMKVNDVSKYVISAAKNPEFAQKLHAVLLESGASPPLDLFVDIGQQDQVEENMLGQVHRKDVEELAANTDNSPTMDVARAFHGEQTHDYCVNSIFSSGQGQQEDSMIIDTCNGLNDDINPMMGIVAEISWEDLQIGERIGIGSYGEVYRADLNGTEVAVKKFLDQDFSGDALVQFKCEIEIMLRLRHPNVVLFMGAVTRPPNLSIVTEFLIRGSLYGLLHRPHPLLDVKRRMRMALDVAKGMNYLHTSNPIIVHRDLKTPNLLVDKNWIVKVCDFGLSRMKHHTFLSSKSTSGTAEWMAPEILRNEPANEKCDVYSFGVILWELATLRVPWRGLNPMQVVGAVGFQNRHLDIPEDVDPAVAEIIRDCWQTEPHLRPSFAQLVSRLRRLQRSFVDRATLQIKPPSDL